MIEKFAKTSDKNSSVQLFLYTFLQHSHDIVFVLTQNNRVIEFNKRAEIYYGKESHEVLEKSYSLLKTLNKEFVNFQKNDVTPQKAMYVKGKSVEWSIIALENFRDSKRCYLVIGRELPEPASVMGKIHNHLEYISTVMPGNFFWKDKDGYYLGYNDALLKTLGFPSKESVVGKTDFDLWPKDASELRINDNLVMNTKTAHYFEESVTLASGETKYFTCIKVPFFDEKNNVIGIIGTSLPITEIKNSQFSLESAKERVEQERDNISKYLQDIISSIPGSIYWKNKDGKYLGCNEFMVKTAGLSTIDDIIGKTDYQLWPEQADALRENDKSVMESDHQITIEEKIVLNGVERFFTVVKMPLKDSQGGINGVMGNSLEITDLKQTQHALEIAKEKSEAANRSKTEFLENMRHDIRTPLTGIVGFASIIRAEVKDKKTREYADNLVASSYALLDLLNEILEVIKVSSGEIPILKKKFDLKKRIQDVIQLNQAKASQKHIKLSFEHDKTLPAYTIGDSRRIHRVILELVANALNFTEKGQIKITTQLIKSKKREIVAQITVEDTGIGMEVDKQQEIFLQFKRLTPSYEGIYKGAGLGLAIVKQFIDELDGEIYVESKIAVGTKFTCILPLKKSLVDNAYGCEENVSVSHLVNQMYEPLFNSTNQYNGNKSNGISTGKNNILLVEDQIISAKIVISLLEGLNCNVDLAENGKIAVQKAQENKYDLIFMDIGLPDIDGYEVTKRIRLFELNKGKAIPIIALTAHVDDENKQRCIEVGMNAVLTKPLVKEKAEDILNGFIPYRKPAGSKLEPTESISPIIEDKIVDFEAAKVLLEGNENLVHEMLNELVNTFPDELAKMIDCYEKAEWIKLKDLAHKMKGGACYCGTTRLKEACYQLEKAVREEERDTYITKYEQLISEIKAVEDEVKNKTYF
jgi:two-component system aerobic respiration control sensor histidine kinase ArcB